MAVGQAPPRAPYASDPALSRGRLVPELPSATRSPFRRDCDRVLHSTAFRRLKHKTQVFIFHEGDHYRTRLTHSLEVAQVARSLARSLGADEDLTEAVALAHDLGHPPFGHAGERALDACLRGAGGFDHNAQALAVVTRLERRYPDFDGLNLTWETLEGILKHNGPLTDRAGHYLGGHNEGKARQMPGEIAAYLAQNDLEVWSHAGIEAQIAAISDDIAYNVHDIDDGLRAHLFTLDDLLNLPLAGDILRDIRKLYPGLEEARQIAQLMRMLITLFIEDVLADSACRLAALAPQSAQDIRLTKAPVIGFSPAIAAAEKALKGFLFKRMYRAERVDRVMADAQRVLADLFNHYLNHPGDVPPDWTGDVGETEIARARRIGDYIAGMTDRYALDEHARIFDSTPELR